VAVLILAGSPVGHRAIILVGGISSIEKFNDMEGTPKPRPSGLLHGVSNMYSKACSHEEVNTKFWQQIQKGSITWKTKGIKSELKQIE
jgi:hypothetical protein